MLRGGQQQRHVGGQVGFERAYRQGRVQQFCATEMAHAAFDMTRRIFIGIRFDRLVGFAVIVVTVVLGSDDNVLFTIG